VFDDPMLAIHNGLAFWPTLLPDVSDDADYLPGHLELRTGGHDNSEDALEIVEREASGRRAVLEIGVALYQRNRTFTDRILRAMDPSGTYLGVDVEDRSMVQRWATNAYFLRADSRERVRVISKMHELGMPRPDLLLIDGHHSVHSALNDWAYASLLEEPGVVLVHDSNSHPGPIALVEAIDREQWTVEEPLRGQRDYGIAVVRRRSA
jgi:hypothetical protein